jgi:hypothetical protein
MSVFPGAPILLPAAMDRTGAGRWLDRPPQAKGLGADVALRNAVLGPGWPREECHD